MNRKQAVFFLILICAPFIVYWDIIFSGYTLSYSEVAASLNQRSGGLLPIADPAAGSLQDHPWLFAIGHSLRQGIIPIVNLQNGLGSPLLESLQSGALYPLNLLLIGMDLSSAQFFDVFSTLHILILAINSFLLFKLYVRWEGAVVLAMAFALSFLTVTHLNMVHYRVFSWTPLLVWASVVIARSRVSLKIILVFIWAIVCSITAGNPQESVFAILVSLLIFSLETGLQSGLKLASVLTFSLSLSAGICLSSPAILPYFSSRSLGLLNSVGSSVERSTSLLDWPWLLGWILPYINGAFTQLYRTSSISHDGMAVAALPSLVLFLLIVGLVRLGWASENGISWREKVKFVLILLIAILGLINISELSPFTGIIRHIPFINTIRITKYTNYIYLLVGICAAISLNWLIQLPLALRQRLSVLASGLFFFLIAAIVVFELSDPAWTFHTHRIDALGIIWLGSLLSLLISVCLLNLRDRPPWMALLLVVLIGALLSRPYGFPKERSKYLVSSTPIATSSARILSAEPANTNLLTQYESISVFDPILNRAFSEWMNRHFRTLNPFFHIQPNPEVEISQNQITLLTLMGVSVIDGYRIAPNSDTTQMSERRFKINQPLPRIFLLRSGAAAEVEKHCADDYATALRLIRENTIAIANSIHSDNNQLNFRLNASGQGMLIALQSYTPAWQLNNQSGTQFCKLFNSWEGNFSDQQLYKIVYFLPGSKIAYWIVGLGVLLLLLTITLHLKLQR